jgi:hypothetical protein
MPGDVAPVAGFVKVQLHIPLSPLRSTGILSHMVFAAVPIMGTVAVEPECTGNPGRAQRFGLTVQFICWVSIAPPAAFPFGDFVIIHVIAAWAAGIDPDLGVIKTTQFSFAISFPLMLLPLFLYFNYRKAQSF